MHSTCRVTLSAACWQSGEAHNRMSGPAAPRACQEVPVNDESVTAFSGTCHVHLTQSVIEQLFCDKYRLHQPDDIPAHSRFVARETVTLVGPRGRLANVCVIGPARHHIQIEISPLDAQTLGLSTSLPGAGDINDATGIFVEGPRACVRLGQGVIRTLP